ncbi:hypothetical protein LJC40_03750 [Synergistaceae bacterium OttesenSCG-928-D05]|nr:hypothetical protein [Synergistaceae bacterium OttesenSCG-928-D05]
MSLILGFFFIFLILAIGDVVSAKTKAFVPSVFVAAALFVAGYWSNFLPLDIVEKTGLGNPLATVAMYVIIVHMGTMMSIRELISEWKTVAIAAAGLAGMIAMLLTVGAAVIGWEAVVIGTPPLSGGIVAAIMMTEAAAAKGLVGLSVLATVIYVMQGFVGYPLTAWCLKFEGKRLLAIYHEGGEELAKLSSSKEQEKMEKKKMIPPMPEKYQTTFTHLAVIGAVAYVSDMLAKYIKLGLTSIDPSYAAYALHPLVICLIVGCIAAELGIIERRPLNKAGSFGFIMATIMAFIMGMLNRSTPEMMMEITGPLAGIIVIGVIGLVVGAAVAGKIFGYQRYMAIALALTALYGFPPNYILTDEAAKALAGNNEEYDFLMGQMLPKMLVGGFITVTITSVILAGVFINML